MKNLSAKFYFLYFSHISYSQSFFKHHYEVTFERAGITHLNKSIVLAAASVTAHNRTARPLNFKFKLLQDLQEDSTVCFSAYQFKSNEYRLTALQFAMKLKKALKIDVAGLNDLVKGASPPIEWPLQKRVTYEIKGWLPDNQNTPFPYAPVGGWKDIIQFYLDNKVTKGFDLELYYRIDDIPEYTSLLIKGGI